MSQVLLTLPTFPTVDHQSVVVGTVLTAAGLLATITLEVIRRRYTAKQIKKMGDDAVKLGKATTALLLGGISALFTGLGYLLVLAQGNSSMLSTLPFVGKHFLEVIGVAYSLYNLRLNKTYQHVADILNKWSSKKATAPALQPTPATTSLPETESNFETS